VSRVGIPPEDRAALRGRSRAAGFSLVELLVAVCVTTVVLCGGWSWCWTVTKSCAAGSDRLDAASSLAFVRRLSTNELDGADALVATSSAVCSATAIAFDARSGAGPALELVTYVYDPDRHVLWRKDPGSHLAEGVDDFSVTYFDAGGHALPLGSGGELAAADLPLVRRVQLTAVVRVSRQTASASWQVCLRCPA